LATRGRWAAVGVNPRFRFIRYVDGGALVPHIDGSWTDTAGRTSLLSVVIYLEEPATGGATRFIGQRELHVAEGEPVVDGFVADWDRFARQDEAYSRVVPRCGSALVFDHALLHDCEPQTGAKTVLRGDIMFEKQP
jgi:hypothetical protein